MTYSFNGHVYDTTFKRMRCDGKVMTKREICWLLHHFFGFYRYMYAYRIYSYNDLFELADSHLSGDLPKFS